MKPKFSNDSRFSKTSHVMTVHPNRVTPANIILPIAEALLLLVWNWLAIKDSVVCNWDNEGLESFQLRQLFLGDLTGRPELDTVERTPVLCYPSRTSFCRTAVSYGAHGPITRFVRPYEIGVFCHPYVIILRISGNVGSSKSGSTGFLGVVP